MTTIKTKNTEAIPDKAPPVLLVGPLAWVRRNLFGSPLDTALTVLGAAFVVGVLTSFLSWAIGAANWFAVTFNLRQFLVGRYEPEAEWRLQLMTLLIAFVVGWAVAAWSHIARRTAIVLVSLLALVFALPPIIAATLPSSPSILTAGQIPVVAGTSTQTPLPQVGFIARQGEAITLQLADQFAPTDEALARLYSFADPAANALRNLAESRLTAQAREPELARALAGDALTANQRARLEAESAELVIPPPTPPTYRLNQSPVVVRILDGATLAPLTEAELASPADALDFVVPRDGWYVLEKSVADADSVALLAADGLYPILERTFTRSAGTDADGGPVEAARVNQFVRMTDNFLVEGGRPRIDTVELPYLGIIENQYRGQRPLHDYLTVFVAPFLARISTGLGFIALAFTLGYLLAHSLDQMSGLARRTASRRTATWMIIVLPPIIFVLVAGFGVLPSTSPPLWGGLLLTMLLSMVGIVVSFPIGVLLALGRRSQLPVVRVVCILYIELVRGVPLITVLVTGMLLVPFVAPWLGGPDTAPYRAMVAVTLFSAAYLAENVRGGLQSLPPGQEEAARALGLAAWQVTLFITLPQALRAVIPALVGQFIALFKDTSLVAIVGLIDLTGIAQATVAQTEFIGVRREVFVFITIVYFCFSYVISNVSRQIEASGVGVAKTL